MTLRMYGATFATNVGRRSAVQRFRARRSQHIHGGRLVRFIAVTMTAALATCAATTAMGQSAETNARSLAATCANCHGTGGVSLGDVPSLAGKPREETVRMMQEFKSGARPGTIMNQLAKGYTDEQIDALAGWFAAQKAPK